MQEPKWITNKVGVDCLPKMLISDKKSLFLLSLLNWLITLTEESLDLTKSFLWQKRSVFCQEVDIRFLSAQPKISDVSITLKKKT